MFSSGTPGRVATVTPPRWQHTDDALSMLHSFVASSAGPLIRVDARLVYRINRGSRRVISRPSTEAILPRRSNWPSHECRMARKMCHILSPLSGELLIGDSVCLFYRCAWFRRRRTWVIILAWVVADPCYTLSIGRNNCLRSSSETSSSGPGKTNAFRSKEQ